MNGQDKVKTTYMVFTHSVLDYISGGIYVGNSQACRIRRIV